MRFPVPVFQTNTLVIGASTSLNVNVPYGLFESDNGNKYIVTHDLYWKFAIALVHSDLPAFTCQPLLPDPIDQGHWLGEYDIRLTHKRHKSYKYCEPGIIDVGDGETGIDCLDLQGKLLCMALGAIDSRDWYYRDHDGWVIQRADTGEPFFEKVHRSNPGRTVRPKVHANS